MGVPVHGSEWGGTSGFKSEACTITMFKVCGLMAGVSIEGVTYEGYMNRDKYKDSSLHLRFRVSKTVSDSLTTADLQIAWVS